MQLCFTLKALDALGLAALFPPFSPQGLHIVQSIASYTFCSSFILKKYESTSKFSQTLNTYGVFISAGLAIFIQNIMGVVGRQNITSTVHGRRRQYGGGRWDGQLNGGTIQYVQPVPPFICLPMLMPHGSHTVLPSCLKVMLINAKSANKMTHLIHNLVVDGDIDLASITETWLSSREY